MALASSNSRNADNKYPANNGPELTISIVSHLHGHMIKNLIQQIHEHTDITFEIILTINEKGDVEDYSEYAGKEFKLIKNQKPKGFGENHNYAFSQASGGFFCVLNPDITIEQNVFTELLAKVKGLNIGCVAPKIIAPEGCIEDNARKTPTIFGLVNRLLRRNKSLDYDIGRKPIRVDWVAGMFMIFPRHVFNTIRGFDESYFMYMEDVDICCEIRKNGYEIVLIPAVKAVHDARRNSRKQAQHLFWHASSALKFFMKNRR